MKKTLIILLFLPCIAYSQIDFSNQNSFDIITLTYTKISKEKVLFGIRSREEEKQADQKNN